MKKELTYQESFDILEAFAYTKKGSLRSISNALELVKETKYQFTDVDEAILLANALVEITPLGHKSSTDFKRMHNTRMDLL